MSSIRIRNVARLTAVLCSVLGLMAAGWYALTPARPAADVPIIGVEVPLPRLLPPPRLRRSETRFGQAGIGVFHSHTETVDGVVVDAVTGPAMEGGLKAGDVILSVDDRPVREHLALHRYGIGDTVRVRYRRTGQPREATVRLGDRLEIMTKACDGGQPQGCFSEGMLLLEGKAYPVQARRAVDRLTSSCDAGFPASCIELGNAYRNGVHVRQDLARALKLFATACDMGATSGCVNMSNLYATGRGVALDLALAAAILDGACRTGDNGACDAARSRRANGFAGGSSIETFVRRLETECAGRSNQSCAELVRFYDDGKRVARNPAKAAVVAKQGCRNDDTFCCRTLARYHARGEGVAKDLSRAAEYLRKACRAGGRFSCVEGEELRTAVVKMETEPTPRPLPPGGSCNADIELDGATQTLSSPPTPSLRMVEDCEAKVRDAVESACDSRRLDGTVRASANMKFVLASDYGAHVQFIQRTLHMTCGDRR